MCDIYFVVTVMISYDGCRIESKTSNYKYADFMN